MWQFNAPKIIFGEDALEHLCELEGRRAFIVTDKMMSELQYVKRVSALLHDAGIKTEVFDEVEPEPSIATVRKGAELMTKFEPDWVIGLGGGSAMDAAKAMWVLYERPDLRIEDINPFTKLGLRRRAKLLTIPTTSGTGADVTWAVVITDPEEKRKLGLASREVIADISIVDPSLPLQMPKSLTASTGLDALTHAIEAYTSAWKNDFSDALAIHTIKLVFEYLPIAYSAGDNNLARERMHNAGTLGGLAFGNSQVGLAHSMGHALGAIFHIPHGIAVGVLLPYVIEYNSKLIEVQQRYTELVTGVGIKISDITTSGKPISASNILAAEIRKLLETVEIGTTLRAIGISMEALHANLDLLIDNTNKDSSIVTNPRSPTMDELRRLYLYAHEGKSIDF
jgi:alcohol dehydrogenase class IV